jgi:hypothetical protein
LFKALISHKFLDISIHNGGNYIFRESDLSSKNTSALLLPKLVYHCCRFLWIIVAENAAFLIAESYVVVIADYSQTSSSKSSVI